MSEKNQMILYSYFRSSASFRVRIALALKDIPYEYRAVHLLKEGGEQRKDTYAELNPMKHVPTLLHGSFVLSESMAILKYLDHVKEAPRLFPKDPQKEAQVMQICEMINSGIQPLQNLKVLQHLENFGVDQEGKKKWIVHWVTQGLDALEHLLEKTSGKQCMGDEWSAADCMLVAQIFSGERFGVTVDPYKNIARIYNGLKDHAAVKAAHPANQPDSE